MLAYLTFGAFSVVGLFMMFIILLQRGRGGGLAGAFGGAGGQSAFGTRAGDVFTKITIGVAVLWVALAAASIFAFREGSNSFEGDGDKDDKNPNMISAPAEGDEEGFPATPPLVPSEKPEEKSDDNPSPGKPE